MNILPTLADVRKIASDGAYKVIPVSCEILSDFITPVEAIKILRLQFKQGAQIRQSRLHGKVQQEIQRNASACQGVYGKEIPTRGDCASRQ